MSLHSYSKCWLHLIWSTRNKEKFLSDIEARKDVSNFLYDYSKDKSIYMKVNYVNADHVHALIDLPTNLSIEDVFQFLKGSSSTYINKENIIRRKFNWGRGYGIFSVSESNIEKATKYIRNQEKHHKRKSFIEEYEAFIKAYGLMYIKEDS